MGKNTMRGRKQCEKRRNCLLQAIAPFLTMFSIAIISLVHQNVALCGNGLKNCPKLKKMSSVIQKYWKLSKFLREGNENNDADEDDTFKDDTKATPYLEGFF